MNDFKCSLIGTDIVHSKNCTNFVNPLVKSIGKTTINSFLNIFFHLICFKASCFKWRKVLIFFYSLMVTLMIMLMKKCVKLVTCNVVMNIKIMKNFLNLQWSSNKDPFSFFTVLNDLFFERSMIHEHIFTSKIRI